MYLCQKYLLLGQRIEFKGKQRTHIGSVLGTQMLYGDVSEQVLAERKIRSVKSQQISAIVLGVSHKNKAQVVINC